MRAPNKEVFIQEKRWVIFNSSPLLNTAFICQGRCAYFNYKSILLQPRNYTSITVGDANHFNRPYILVFSRLLSAAFVYTLAVYTFLIFAVKFAVVFYE